MEAKTKKYLKVGGLILAGIAVLVGGYKGYKYIINKINSDADLKGKDTEVTLPDGTVITVTADALKPPTKEDIDNLVASAYKAQIKAPNMTTAYIEKLRTSALKLKRWEIQRLTGLFDYTAIGTGLNANQLKEFNSLILKMK